LYASAAALAPRTTARKSAMTVRDASSIPGKTASNAVYIEQQEKALPQDVLPISEQQPASAE